MLAADVGVGALPRQQSRQSAPHRAVDEGEILALWRCVVVVVVVVMMMYTNVKHILHTTTATRLLARPEGDAARRLRRASDARIRYDVRDDVRCGTSGRRGAPRTRAGASARRCGAALDA
jgi:hypothetical protein